MRGQAQAKRALEVAAAGSHSLLMIGPPGTGKSMLAQRLPGLLPPLTEDEALESAALAFAHRPLLCPATGDGASFRAPHHTASAVALVGGGSDPRPGEISLAHHGVLFLDELPEWDRRVLEVLREPIESGRIHISRAARQATFPARFQFVAAMNPCPCGYLGHASGRCRCTPDQIARYRARISGPLLDRIDLQIDVPRCRPTPCRRRAAPRRAGRAAPSFAGGLPRRHGASARGRRSPTAGSTSRRSSVGAPRIAEAEALLKNAFARLSLSARAYHRILKVARTIADLAGVEAIGATHVAEAIGYRQLDRIA